MGTSAIQEVFAFTVITSLRSVKSGEKLPGTHATLSTLLCVYVHSSPETALGILKYTALVYSRSRAQDRARVYEFKGCVRGVAVPRPSVVHARDSIINAKL